MRFAPALLLLWACDKQPADCPVGEEISAEDRTASCAGELESCLPAGTVGTGSGGAFRPFDAGESVSLDVAPQGGFGVSVKVRTTGLIAGDDKVATVTLDVELDGQNVGTHEQPVSLLCQTNGEGEVFGVVVGFDPAVYGSNDDLLQLDGSEVVLKVRIEDEVGTAVTAESTVVVNVGG